MGHPSITSVLTSLFAFTEQGVAMLSSVLHSEVAIRVNINISCAFVSIRQYVLASEAKNEEIEELKQRIQELEESRLQSFRNDQSDR